MQWRETTAIRQMSDLVQQQFPGYWQELQGMATGLGLPVEDVFAWNCRGDFWAMAPDGCTTVQLPGDGYPLFAHNEDGDPDFCNDCSIVEIEVDGAQKFASFVYPVSLPGHTFAVTANGLAMTVNNLRCLHGAPGVARMVLARAMLDQTDVASAIALIKKTVRSGGFHFTLGQAGSHDLYSVEFSATECSVVKLNGPALHANHMVHAALSNQPQVVTGSSGYRQIRGEELIRQARDSGSTIDPLSILFDQHNAKFPIFRNDLNDSDQENTLATARIQIAEKDVHWQVHCGRSSEPIYHFINGARIS